ncbi:E3 ubiquitin-protein ligase RNF180 isoform X2 [Cuculus canorus]|uniref:E3 ubiquitin-protein ligase RNF180 isoform X2 n=1 Tax=Cuculus canorus TaxID=55661 RepID=UPI0023AA3A8F|nr:E3 ubiquitin-protein ligase RNF180 isoform X2 [Cuculus canorus]
MSNREVDVLRCWKCRKYIANSVCLAKCHGKELYDAQWTTGKLRCPFCEGCLGVFNFVRNTKCSCGQLVNVHFCRSRTDYQPAFSVTLAKSSGKQLPPLKIQSGYSEDTCHEVVTAALEIKNQGLSYIARSSDGTGRLTEALCLEVRASRFEMKSKTLRLKASDQERNLSAFCPGNDACTVKPFHRRSHSLDLNIRETFVLSPALYETCSTGAIYHGQNENRSVYTENGLQLRSGRKDGSSFQELHRSSADKLQKRFRVTSHTPLVHRETESERDFEATGQSSGSAIADESPFVVKYCSPTSTVEGEQYVTPVGLVQPTNISFNRRLNKRERNKLKSLKRKQRRQEQWLQKQVVSCFGAQSHLMQNRQSCVKRHVKRLIEDQIQADLVVPLGCTVTQLVLLSSILLETANDNLPPDDEHELRGDKESYLCAVCLDVYFNPYMCYPCHHIFCEPCLRRLAKDNPTSTPCPLCRTTITRVFFQTELNNSTKSFFPMEYLKLKENFQKSNSAKWPLPSCKKTFRVFETGFQRHTGTVTRRHFPHAAHRMDYMDFEDDSRGWRFDMDMVIIYIYSVNWVIGFIVFCFLCYFFFPF